VFELDDFVFYSELLSLEIGDCIHVRQGALSFLVQRCFKAVVPMT